MKEKTKVKLEQIGDFAEIVLLMMFSIISIGFSFLTLPEITMEGIVFLGMFIFFVLRLIGRYVEYGENYA